MFLLFALAVTLLVERRVGEARLPKWLRFGPRFYGRGPARAWMVVAWLLIVFTQADVLLILLAGPNDALERTALLAELALAALWVAYLLVATSPRPD
jgi:hypothetical protein